MKLLVTRRELDQLRLIQSDALTLEKLPDRAMTLLRIDFLAAGKPATFAVPLHVDDRIAEHTL